MHVKRVVGFVRPVEGFNDAKFQEFNDRVLFEVDKNECDVDMVHKE